MASPVKKRKFDEESPESRKKRNVDDEDLNVQDLMEKLKEHVNKKYILPPSVRYQVLANNLTYDLVMQRFLVDERKNPNYITNIKDFLYDTDFSMIERLPYVVKEYYNMCPRVIFKKVDNGSYTEINALLLLLIRRHYKFLNLPRFNILPISMSNFLEGYKIAREYPMYEQIIFERYIDQTKMFNCEFKLLNRIYDGLLDVIRTGEPFVIYFGIGYNDKETILRFEDEFTEHPVKDIYGEKGGHQLSIIYQKVDDDSGVTILRQIIDTSQAILEKGSIQELSVKRQFRQFYKCLTNIEQKVRDGVPNRITFKADPCISQIQGRFGICGHMSLIITLIALKNNEAIRHGKLTLKDICTVFDIANRSDKSHTYLLKNIVGEFLVPIANLVAEATWQPNTLKIINDIRFSSDILDDASQWKKVASFHQNLVDEIMRNILLGIASKTQNMPQLKMQIDNLQWDKLKSMIQ